MSTLCNMINIFQSLMGDIEFYHKAKQLKNYQNFLYKVLFHNSIGKIYYKLGFLILLFYGHMYIANTKTMASLTSISVLIVIFKDVT